MAFVITAISGGYFDIALDSYHTFLKQNTFLFIGTFYPSGADPT